MLMLVASTLGRERAGLIREPGRRVAVCRTFRGNLSLSRLAAVLGAASE